MTLNFEKTIDQSLELLLRLKKVILPHVKDEEIVAHHEDGLHYIEIQHYAITPVEGNRKTVGGSCPTLEWRLTRFDPILETYNDPQDVDEVDCGTFKHYYDCMLVIAEEELKNTVYSMVDEYYWGVDEEEEEKMWEEMEKNPPDSPKKCVHGKNFEECDECLVLADFAIDSKREGK